jgi:hypothetical protein
MKTKTILILSFIFILNAIFGAINVFHKHISITYEFTEYSIHIFALYLWINLLIKQLNKISNEN